LGIALKANPEVAWFIKNKNPKLERWVDRVISKAGAEISRDEIRAAEETILRSMNDLVCYAVNPTLYDQLPFLKWDSTELSSLTSFNCKTVIDIGAGTGRLTFIASQAGAHAVFAVEPVGNLRVFIKEKASRLGITNIYTMDGLITDLPFPDHFIAIVMGGHVFGDAPEDEYSEMARVTKPGGMIILCPGENDTDSDRHKFLLDLGFEWSRFEEPGDGFKRKYWKTTEP
jgi:SAM-dependent methyltransferase